MSPLATNAKLYSRIGEVARLTGLKPSVLRFWETEFPEIAPQKSQTGQRLYAKQSIELIHLIKDLLYREKLTIAGARSRLRQKAAVKQVATDLPELKQQFVDELKEIRTLLLG